MKYRLPFRNKVFIPSQTVLHVLGSKLTLYFVCYLVAAISFGGFFEKWAFRDGKAGCSVIEMLDGTAKRPYVYRRLLPTTANLIDKAVPERLNHEFTGWLAADPKKHNFIHRYFSNARDSVNPTYALRYYALFVLCFASYLLGILAIKAVCQEIYPDTTAATLAAFLMAIIFPLLTTQSGYMYDMVELLFMAQAVLAAVRGRIFLLAGITALATFNKESFFFFVLTLYPFLREKFSARKTLAIETGLLAVGGAVNLLVKFYYAGNPGSMAVEQLAMHLKWLLNPYSYLQFEVNYGAVTPQGVNLVYWIILGFIVSNAWSHLPKAFKRHGQIALGINIPLFIAFCYQGELRNLSMLFVTFAVMLCITISRHLQQRYGGASAIRAGPLQS
jgi:fluoride ion exporter CrcB/FEX